MGLYLNNASTTKPDKKVIDDFVWCAENCWHNPSDVSLEGLNAKDIIETAQKQIATSINASPEEIIFTSGGSESNNWAIKGYVDNYNADLILTTEIEHPSVYNTCVFCEEHGTELFYMPVDRFGVVSLSDLEMIMGINDCRKVLVSIMFSNNEIGTVQPIKKISEIVHKYNGILHVDAVQAFMHTEIDVEDMGIDMLSASFHKFGGFKNCGFLYVKNGIELTPLIHGGKQFNFKRAGTENVPMIYAMGNQVERLNGGLLETQERNKELFDYFVSKIHDKCKDLCYVRLNGDKDKRMFSNLNITFGGIDSNTLISLLEMKEVYVSAGSACCAGEHTPSRVLKAIGLTDEEAFNTIRISFDSNITKDTIDEFVNILSECIVSLQIFNLTN